MIKKALIVDDDIDILSVMQEVFSKHGYRVSLAQNSNEAINMLEHHHSFDVMLADVVMPTGMNGITLARMIKKVCPRMKIIIGSGYSKEVLSRDYDYRDEFTLINKPYRLQEISNELSA